jgi:CheY-like chemotaxis protein
MKTASGEELETMMNQYSRLSHEFELINGYAWKSEIVGVLKGLGFTEEEFSKQISTLSGGQKTRVSLGKLLLTNPDIILLDLNIPKVSGLEILEFLKKEADYIIDTSRLLTRELKTELEKIFVQDEEFNSMYVTILSFGFKYGIPADSDIVMDVRFLPNPYYVEELRPKTGNDVEIQQYVMKYDEAKIFLNKLEDMVTFLIPHYISEGKNQLVISIGCTGGKHRSVTLANELYKRLSQKKNREYGLKIEHRDIGKDALRGK